MIIFLSLKGSTKRFTTSSRMSPEANRPLKNIIQTKVHKNKHSDPRASIKHKPSEPDHKQR